MDLEQTIDIAAPPETVWAIMTDIERWPEWTASVERMERLAPGAESGAAQPLAPGGRVRAKQPKLPAMVWTVSAVEPGAAFTWATSSRGLKVVAGHRVEPTGTGSRVTLSLHQTGLPVLLMPWYIRGIGRRYMAMEAEGLKARAEGRR